MSGKSLFIAEKPSVAMEFAKALGVTGAGCRHDGYVENDNYIVTWCVGHLITMSLPDAYGEEMKAWSFDTLPFIPKTYKYEVIGNVKKQYEVVAKLLNRKDVANIYYSGDSAREGEYIQRLVRMMAGHNQAAHERRVWIDSQTDEEIHRGIREAKDLTEYDALSDAAYARAIEDYLVGMNFSRALSIKYSNTMSNAAGLKHAPIAVGRVMSCVLGMIVNRENEIRNTVTFPYYGISASIDGTKLVADWKIVEKSIFRNHPDNYNNIGLKSKDPVGSLVKQLNAGGKMTLVNKNKTSSSKAAPLLFNLAELQGECTKRFHISPSETLNIAQSLYEKKLTTYPRTDARVLTNAVAKVYAYNINGLKKIPELAAFADYILTNNLHTQLASHTTKYIDDSKVSDHYAIIPTGEGFENLNQLTDTEKAVYDLICRRFLSIFYPSAEYDKLALTFEAGNETFQLSVTAIAKEGYLAIAGHKDDTENAKNLKDAEAISGTIGAQFAIKEGTTKPPARYTTGSLILAMENAGNLIEDDELREQIKSSGIGTSATRAETISKLEKIHYIKVNHKTQTITPDMMGELVFAVLKEAFAPILNPSYTATWEKALSMIEHKELTKDKYLAQIYNYVTNGVNSVKQHDYKEQVASAISELGKYYPDIKKKSGGELPPCPYCGKPLRESDRGYYCSGYKEGCKFSLWKTFPGKNGKILPSSVVQTLLSAHKTGDNTVESDVTAEVKGFKKKAGGTFSARLKLTGTIGEYPKVDFVFAPRH